VPPFFPLSFGRFHPPQSRFSLDPAFNRPFLAFARCPPLDSRIFPCGPVSVFSVRLTGGRPCPVFFVLGSSYFFGLRVGICSSFFLSKQGVFVCVSMPFSGGVWCSYSGLSFLSPVLSDPRPRSDMFPMGLLRPLFVVYGLFVLCPGPGFAPSLAVLAHTWGPLGFVALSAGTVPVLLLKLHPCKSSGFFKFYCSLVRPIFFLFASPLRPSLTPAVPLFSSGACSATCLAMMARRGRPLGFAMIVIGTPSDLGLRPFLGDHVLFSPFFTLSFPGFWPFQFHLARTFPPSFSR